MGSPLRTSADTSVSLFCATCLFENIVVFQARLEAAGTLPIPSFCVPLAVRENAPQLRPQQLGNTPNVDSDARCGQARITTQLMMQEKFEEPRPAADNLLFGSTWQTVADQTTPDASVALAAIVREVDQIVLYRSRWSEYRLASTKQLPRPWRLDPARGM